MLFRSTISALILAAALAGCGGGNSPAPTPAPTVTITANTPSIIIGGSSTLSWSSTNASTCTAVGDWSGSRNPSGSEVVTPTSTGTSSYTLICNGAGGSLSATVDVVVGAFPTPVLNFSATPTAVALGESLTLSWTTTGATNCVASGDWSGVKNLNGSEIITPTRTGSAAYTMDCANSGPSHNRLTANASVTAPFAYVTNGEGSISGYVVNSVTGALTEVTGSPFLALTDPRSFVVDPQKRFAYVANYGSNNLYSYTVDSITGALSGIARGPFATGGHPNSITTEPTGRYVYVATQDNGTVSHYGSVTSGVLTGFGTAVSGSHAVIIHPSAKFLYSVGPGSGVFAYSIDPSTQDLTAIPGSPFPSGLGASFIAIDPLGKFVYVANFGSGNISAYSIDQNSGSLAPIAGTPFVAGQSPRSVAIHPSGKFLYVANAGGPTSSGNVSAYVIDATTGALTQIAGSPFTAGNGLISITVEPKGKFAYVAAGSFTTDYNILSFAIDGTTGTLTAAPANTVVTNKTLTFMTITR